MLWVLQASHTDFLHFLSSDPLVTRKGLVEAACPAEYSSSELQRLCQVLTGRENQLRPTFLSPFI